MPTNFPTSVDSFPTAATLSAQKIGFWNATPVAKPTGVAVTAAGIHAALVSIGLIGV